MTRVNPVRKVGRRGEDWRGRIEAQERSGISVKQFCEERGLTEQSFYSWRKRLRSRAPLRFALVETERSSRATAAEATMELVLTTGERLRIGADVDPAALRKVLEALRA
jgi:hypothetical protein